MSTYEVSVSAIIEMESEEELTEDEAIEYCRKDPTQLLHHLEVDLIEEKEEE